MAQEEQLTILRQGLKKWNVWRVKNIRRANLAGADLSGVNLQGVDLQRANLQGTNLQRANLQGTNLLGADLQGANLSGANISGAKLGFTILAYVDLREVQGLDKVVHFCPSTLAIDTLIASGGHIPDVFLRGCGVPDSWIEYLPSLLDSLEPIQFYSCFISYTEKDTAFAKRLHERLRRENLRVWFAPDNLKGGHKLREQLHDAIQMYDKFLLILSDASVESNWVANEVKRAYTREHKEKRRILFPISLNDFDSLKKWTLPNDDTGEDLAEEIRRYYVPDFSNWKDNDAFEASFARLLNDLKANDAVLPKL